MNVAKPWVKSWRDSISSSRGGNDTISLLRLYCPIEYLYINVSDQSCCTFYLCRRQLWRENSLCSFPMAVWRVLSCFFPGSECWKFLFVTLLFMIMLTLIIPFTSLSLISNKHSWETVKANSNYWLIDTIMLLSAF